MQDRFFTHWILAGLIGMGLISGSNAQTITTGTLAVSELCVPSTLSVPFTKTGTFGAGNSFSVELSGPTGSFDSPRVLAGSGVTSPLSVTLPGDVVNGTGYKVRVVASDPQDVRSTSPSTLTLQQVPAAPAVTTTAYTYCIGATALPLSATASDGNSLKWYDSGGSSLASAPVPSTTIAGTQTYAVAQATSAGCTSAKVTITVQVISPPLAPTTSPVQVCEGGVATPLTAGGNSLRWYDAADNPLPGAPIPSNTTPSTYKVSQTAFGCESAKSIINVSITPRPTPPGVTASYTYCSGQTIPPLTATGSGLKWYDASDSPLGSAPTPSNTAGSSYKVSQTVNGCESDKATISVNITQTPAPTATTSVEYCAGQPAAVLTATGTDLKWYAGPTGGSGSTTAPTPNTAAAGTTDYYVSQTLNGCESARTKITVVVKAVPITPGVSALSVCEGVSAGPLTANGTNLLWYTAATGGSGSGTAPAPSTAAAGSNSYYVSQTVNGCESPRAKLDVTVLAKPAPPGVTASYTYCSGQTIPPLTATGSGLKWYDASDNPLGSAPTPSNTTGSSYKVSQTVNGCESDKATISVNITQTPVPTATTFIQYCLGETAAALTATGTNLKWYDKASGGTALAGAPTPSTAAPAALEYFVSQTQNGCESDRIKITVLIKSVPAAPVVNPITLCEGSTTPALTATGSDLMWYREATGGSGNSNPPVVNTGTAGASSYYVTQTVNGCESPRAKLDVTVKVTPPAPTTAANVPFCIGAPETTLTATGTALTWYQNSTALAKAPVPSTKTAGTTVYQVSQTINGCESPKATITVTVYRTNLPAVTSPVEYCNNEPAIPLVATGTSLKWYDSSTGGTASTTTPTPSTSAVKTTTYYVTQTQNNCESDRARIDVLVKPIPVQPTIAATTPVCQQGTVPLLVSAVSGITGTLKWYEAATGGTGSGTVPKPSADNAGTITYYVTQTVNNCESPRAVLTQEIKALPTRPTVTTPLDLCEKGAAQPLSATGENLKWYSVASGGNPSTTAPTPSTASVTNTSFYVSQTTLYPVGSGSLACEGPRAKIDVQVNPLPGLPAVTPQVICQERQDRNISFTANGENLKWYPAASGGSPLDGTPSVNVKEAQEKAYYVSQTTAKGCEGSRAEVKIRVKRLPGLPGVTPSIEYCQFDKPNPLTATPESNAVLNWYGTNASGGTSSGVAPTPSTDTGGTTDFYLSQTLEGCEGDRTSIKVLVKTTPKPGVTTPVEYCQNVTAQPLSAQGSKLKWYREATATESQPNPFTPFTASVGSYAFYVTQTGDNGCESPKEKIDVRIKPLPSATISGDNSIGLGQSAEILVTFTGDGPWDYTLSNNLTMKGVTENPQRITVTPERTTTYTVTEVANACGKGIPNGSAMVTVRIPTISTGNPTIANLCAGTSFTLPFQASGDFVTGNKFNVQISLTDADEGFRTIPTVRQGNDAIATVPDTLPGGNYYVRVVGESPQFIIKGSVSPVTVTVKPRPTATLTGSTTILIGETATVNVAFTGDGPWTFRFNDGIRDSLITTSVTPFVIVVKPSATTTYSLSTVSNQCGMGNVSGTARIQVDPILANEPTFSATWLKVYPSPVQTICVVEMDTPPATGEAQLQVFDTRGRSVFNQKIHAARTEVDFTSQPTGLYFLKIENGGRTAVRRIIKQD
ncbi:Ig-like domain-containing protein [Salmonirosea aquatica]|uniref:T9SS type A sorting domain-containing protein n=1 Tax=Salmonirosea aquatica TaxID=2654236 RepID=A0A7C9BGL0_9BACT|nr:T9SS type A sorting domain-containing protein [Cytophagaceae bacterium SJW1-29]